MKNIGLKLKEKREQNGLSIEEVAEDLKMRPSQISSIEEGKAEDFKDVFYLKYFIRDYAKYLGLDSEKILDEFNEYLFDVTSKIPVNTIAKEKKKKDKEGEISSPYTKEVKKKKLVIRIVALAILVVAIVITLYAVVSAHKGNDFSSQDITYNIRR